MVKLILILVLQLVIFIVMINMTTGRTVMSSYGEHSSPSSYVFHHWYDPTVESEDGKDDNNTDNVDEYNNVLDVTGCKIRLRTVRKRIFSPLSMKISWTKYFVSKRHLNNPLSNT